MTIERRKPLVAAIILAGLAAPIMAQSIVAFDAPNATDTWPTHINNNGEIVGYFVDASQATHGFLRERDGSIIVIDAPNSRATVAVSINDSGEIVGYFDNASPDFTSLPFEPKIIRGFLRDWNGAFTVFDVPKASFTLPSSINARGEVAGQSQEYYKMPVGFVRDRKGGVTLFGPGRTWPTAINNLGEIAGHFYDSDSSQRRERGFVRQTNGDWTVFDGPNTIHTWTVGLNNRGDVTGYLLSQNETRSYVRNKKGDFPLVAAGRSSGINNSGAVIGITADGKGFVLSQKGIITYFDVPSSSGSSPQGINDCGDVVGMFRDLSQGNIARGFVRFSE